MFFDNRNIFIRELICNLYFSLLLCSTTVGSEIIGASLHCGKNGCVTNNTISNVTIIFQYDSLSEVILLMY